MFLSKEGSADGEGSRQPQDLTLWSSGPPSTFKFSMNEGGVYFQDIKAFHRKYH